MAIKNNQPFVKLANYWPVVKIVLHCDTAGWASGRASGLFVWLSVWSEVQIVSYGPADATAIPNPIVSCFI